MLIAAAKKKLTKDDIAIAELYVIQGMSGLQISRTLKLSPKKVDWALHKDAVVELCASMQEKIIDEGYNKAVKVLNKQMDSENEWVAQNAAKYIIQMRINQQQKQDKTVMVVFEGMSEPKKITDTMTVDGEVE